MPPKRQVSRQFADRVIFGADAEEPSPEEQPLRRGHSRDENRERFRTSQQEAARNLFYQYSCCICVCVLLIIVWALIGLYMYVWGWITWIYYHEIPCDQPLAGWLLAQLIWPLIQTCAERIPGLRAISKTVPYVIVIVGAVLFFNVKTCPHTNPELYILVYYYLLFLGISYALGFFISCFLIGLIIYGMMHGWFDQANGADPETIKKIQTVTYDPSLFAEEGRTDDDRPSSECCCCQEQFGADKPIKRTSCQHYFHEECLEKWLKLAKTCPICRLDLDAEYAETDADKEP